MPEGTSTEETKVLENVKPPEPSKPPAEKKPAPAPKGPVPTSSDPRKVAINYQDLTTALEFLERAQIPVVGKEAEALVGLKMKLRRVILQMEEVAKATDANSGKK